MAAERWQGASDAESYFTFYNMGFPFLCAFLLIRCNYYTRAIRGPQYRTLQRKFHASFHRMTQSAWRHILLLLQYVRVQSRV